MFINKWRIILIVFSFFLSGLIGCNSQKPEPQPAMELPEEITIAYVAMTNTPTSPQALVGRDKGIFEEYLSEHDITVNWIITRDRDHTAPLMQEDNVDFIYIPINNFSAYSSQLSAFGGGDNFRLIAGSTERSDGYSLVVREGINSLNDLGAKTVGIPNDSLVTELAFANYLKSETDLKPDSVGGTVQIKFQDYIHLLNEGFNNGEYDAIITRNNFVAQALEENQNAKELIITPPAGAPNINLIARKAIIDNFPDVTKSVLQAHIEATKEARTASPEYLAELQINTYEFYVKEVLGAHYEPPAKERIVNGWTGLGIVDTPNLDFIEELVNYMQKAGYYEGKGMDNYIDLRLLRDITAQ
ncbi:ABC transporter substrate-binding protein [Dethiobacter alkaliphilus]|uniref:ABC transporter substrate-binding protein n=1 Tax=Dethiobacter alkaliphilus TaxID=427926 RepID=UPI002225D62A|nr:hypothetical protein [Dethiobacter alkaliphilus]MCW3491155.1 hypothetical protein [Dethiobacter alkaliphilus]